MKKLTAFEKSEIAKKHAIGYWGAGAMDNKLVSAIAEALEHAEKILAEKNVAAAPSKAAGKRPEAGWSMSCPSCGVTVLESCAGPQKVSVNAVAWSEMWKHFDQMMSSFDRLFK